MRTLCTTVLLLVVTVLHCTAGATGSKSLSASFPELSSLDQKIAVEPALRPVAQTPALDRSEPVPGRLGQ